VDLEIRKAYENLKAALLQKGCKVIAEEPPTFISVRQGSLWGISPRTAKKVVNCRFSSGDSGTRIVVSSSLSSDWKNLTLIGSALSIIVASLCWWIAADLEGFAESQQPSYWSWIIENGGYTNLGLAQTFVGLTRGLAIFLVVIVFLEVIVYAYVKSRMDEFAEEALKPLH
jgi:cbb3-type cytochrome oxidase subunit 3